MAKTKKTEDETDTPTPTPTPASNNPTAAKAADMRRRAKPLHDANRKAAAEAAAKGGE